MHLQCRRCEFDPWVGKTPWGRKWQPTSVSCLENPMDKGAWWVTVHGVTKSWTRLRDFTFTFTSHTECVFIVTVVLENSKPNSWLNNINLCGHRWPIQLCSVSIDSSFDLFFLILIFILCSFISQSYGLYFLGLCQILCGMR